MYNLKQLELISSITYKNIKAYSNTICIQTNMKPNFCFPKHEQSLSSSSRVHQPVQSRLFTADHLVSIPCSPCPTQRVPSIACSWHSTHMRVPSVSTLDQNFPGVLQPELADVILNVLQYLQQLTLQSINSRLIVGSDGRI